METKSTESGVEIYVAEIEIISLAEATSIPVTQKGSAEVTPEKSQDWRFLSLRSPHGGWGFGGARFIKQLLELPTIHEACFLFRAPSRLMP